jgi:F0F1-type ATP synthase assembly protein I
MRRRLLQIGITALIVFGIAIHLWVSKQFGMWVVIIVSGLLILHIPVAIYVRRSLRRRRAAAAFRVEQRDEDLG